MSAPTIVNKPSAKNGIRLCIDSRPLDTSLKRSEYPIPTVEIRNAKVFTLANIKSSFWHVPLDEPSSLLTTFNTPVGRMKWNRMPFDALSRSHTTNHIRSQSEEEIETIGLVIQDESVTSHLKEIAEETAKDNVLQSVIHHISGN